MAHTSSAAHPRTEAIAWSDAAEEIVAGDQIVGLGYATPASGVVIVPVTNFAVHDRAAGTIAVNSSVGAWKKLDRIRRNPHVALAFHTREHGLSARPEYVLAQGTATLSDPVPDYPSSIIERWERYERWRDIGPLWKRWLRIYALRVEIEIAVERLLVCPDLDCRGAPEVTGAPLPAHPPRPQPPPARGTGPRINHARAARLARKLPHRLLGWIDADGFPFLVPVEVGEATAAGILLEAPEAVVPPGGRRAGLTAHWFAPRVIGQHQRVHTGWMESAPTPGRAVYAPHTTAAYRFPASEIAFRIAAGGGTRARLRGARRAGFVPD